MDSPRSRDSSEPAIDPAHPFKGVVVCCTSIPPDQRTQIATKTEELGGIHKYDLTPDVTHLVVGDYDTPKYRHVAKERTDIKVMDAKWIDTVGDLWMKDADIDFAALEREWQLKPLETCGHVVDAADSTEAKRGSLLLCMTGFDDPDQRNSIIEKITSNGGAYTGDLTKRVSHLIVRKPEGKKYKAARAWNIRTVSLPWLEQSIERGLILDEQCFDPVLPAEEQGQGAWNRVTPRKASAGKRSRSGAGEIGQRKLRKTASMKLGSQRDMLWGDILGNKPSAESAGPGDTADRIEVQDSGIHDRMVQSAPDAGIFSACSFFMSGFEPWKSKILADTIVSLGGQVCDSFQELSTKGYEARSTRRLLIVPQESQPTTHLRVPPEHIDKIQIVTEFFIERCLHNKAFRDPDNHILGRPLPVFPIHGFKDISICTAGFSGIDLLHVEKAITQIGARFASRLNDTTSVLVCRALAETRKEKLKLALDNNIPAVSSEWLWECMTTGFNVPIKEFMYPELGQPSSLQPKPKPKETTREDMKQAFQRTRSEPVPQASRKPAARHSTVVGGIDTTAFLDDEGRQKPATLTAKVPAVRETSSAAFAHRETTIAKAESAASLQFQTAKTHQADSFGAGTVLPSLTDATPSDLKAEQPVRQPVGLARTTSVADSLDATPISLAEAQAPVEPGAVTDAASEQNQVKTKPIDCDEEETEAERKRQRDAMKNAEKEDLTSKLASLIESKPSSENAPDVEGSGPLQQPTRRAKRIFGRAISNASAASSGSAESRMDSMGRTAEEKPQQEKEQEPPSTQIQYQDPGAQQHRAKMMSKIASVGGEGAGKAVAPSPPVVSQPARKKISTIGGFDFSDEARPNTRQLRRK
ncbi:BRCA1 C Terminus domain-containing protein [Colletotrichum abscissum]|uniref:BRCA1 C Terminus domain-containing protein n=1 Tax=Colletotrichum abscissum TaxID=1671311 RepID=A0A9P9XEI2_9PEZI|nr:BRCA1 C Terminus domain-containing protein [Colletotrichum abscissum]KAI3550461.1 BRCA1 C Terminus domain-containing protein [Colletotrichum abscissum]KAK1485829.1 BRCA1 C Terminus domain-containing protein [Colletotrichum abscissum]